MEYNSIQFTESPSNELFTPRTEVFPPPSFVPSSSSQLNPTSLPSHAHHISSLSPTSSQIPIPSSLILASSLSPSSLLPSHPRYPSSSLHPSSLLPAPTSFFPPSSSNAFPSSSIQPTSSLPPLSLPPPSSLPSPEVEDDDDSEEVDILFFSMMKTNIVWQLFFLLVMAKFLDVVRTDLILGLGLGNDFINFLILKKKMNRVGREVRQIQRIWIGRLDSACLAAYKVWRDSNFLSFICYDYRCSIFY